MRPDEDQLAYLLHGYFNTLAVQSVRYGVGLHDTRRHMSRRPPRANLSLDCILERFIQRLAFGKLNEENDTLVRAVRDGLSDGKAVKDLPVKAVIDDLIDLCRAEAYATRVSTTPLASHDHEVRTDSQNAVRSSQHNDSASILGTRTSDDDVVAVICGKLSQYLRRRVKTLYEHQTPGNSEKYDCWYRAFAFSTASAEPNPSRGQNPTGWHGKGFRQTSSPGSSGGEIFPSGVKASIAMPSIRHCISPRKTGSAVHMPAKREQISVPPTSVSQNVIRTGYAYL